MYTEYGAVLFFDPPATGPTSIKCLTCLRRSHNINDVLNLYCGHYHLQHDPEKIFEMPTPTLPSLRQPLNIKAMIDWQQSHFKNWLTFLMFGGPMNGIKAKEVQDAMNYRMIGTDVPAHLP